VADYAVTNTPRVIVAYTSAGIEHHAEARRPRDEASATSITQAHAFLADFFGALAPLLPEDFLFTDSVYIPQDSEVSTPSGSLPGNPTGLQAVADYTAVMKVTATTFSAKSSASKTRISAFGVFWDPSDVSGPAANGKVTALEDSNVALAITNMNTVARTYAIDGTLATFHPSATVKPNDKLMKLVRRGLLG